MKISKLGLLIRCAIGVQLFIIVIYLLSIAPRFTSEVNFITEDLQACVPDTYGWS